MYFYETKNIADPALTLCTHMLLEEFLWIAWHNIEIFQIRLALDLYTHQMLEVELPFTNPFRSNCLNVFLNILIFFWYIIVLYPQLLILILICLQESKTKKTLLKMKWFNFFLILGTPLCLDTTLARMPGTDRIGKPCIQITEYQLSSTKPPIRGVLCTLFHRIWNQSKKNT